LSRHASKVLSCNTGYNCTVFAYGQTGAGKTYTMQGRGFDSEGSAKEDDRGLQPRVFDFLFARTREDMASGSVEHLLKCSYYEIYNEQIVDLVNSVDEAKSSGWQLAGEGGPQKGCFY